MDELMKAMKKIERVRKEDGNICSRRCCVPAPECKCCGFESQNEKEASDGPFKKRNLPLQLCFANAGC